jgi:hypothetical protein
VISTSAQAGTRVPDGTGLGKLGVSVSIEARKLLVTIVNSR